MSRIKPNFINADSVRREMERAQQAEALATERGKRIAALELALTAAAETAAQQQFEADVRALCIECRNGYAPMVSQGAYMHYSAKPCRAAALHATFPARSEAMNSDALAPVR